MVSGYSPSRNEAGRPTIFMTNSVMTPDSTVPKTHPDSTAAIPMTKVSLKNCPATVLCSMPRIIYTENSRLRCLSIWLLIYRTSTIKIKETASTAYLIVSWNNASE